MGLFWKITAGFFLFALLHSLLAAFGVQRRLERLLGPLTRCYRLLYNLVSVATFAALVILLPPRGPILYEVPPPFSFFLIFLQFVAAVVFIAALRDFDNREFLGLDCFKSRTQQSPPRLNTGGLFRYCRHPLYTAATLYLLAQPTMSLGRLAYTINIILYFWIGSYFEEKRLIRIFGDAYVEYRRRVPRFIPLRFR